MRPYVGTEDLKSIIDLWCACRIANTINPSLFHTLRRDLQSALLMEKMSWMRGQV